MKKIFSRIGAGWKSFRSNKVLSWLFDILVFFGIFMIIYSWQTRHLITADGTQAIPDFVAITISGEEVTSEQLKGKNHLVYFFAPWCGACNMSMSNLTKLRESVNDDELGIYLVALSYKDKKEIETYAERHELNIPVILGTPRIAHDFNINSFPTYYVLNDEGKIISRDVGYSTQTGMKWRSGNLGI